jgi:hypothetical protein
VGLDGIEGLQGLSRSSTKDDACEAEASADSSNGEVPPHRRGTFKRQGEKELKYVRVVVSWMVQVVADGRSHQDQDVHLGEFLLEGGTKLRLPPHWEAGRQQ